MQLYAAGRPVPVAGVTAVIDTAIGGSGNVVDLIEGTVDDPRPSTLERATTYWIVVDGTVADPWGEAAAMRRLRS